MEPDQIKIYIREIDLESREHRHKHGINGEFFFTETKWYTEMLKGFEVYLTVSPMGSSDIVFCTKYNL